MGWLILCTLVGFGLWVWLRERTRQQRLRKRYWEGGVFVAIDLETVGLKAVKGGITEVAAVKFSKDRVLETFGSVVKPAVAIPLEVQVKTGITLDTVRAAPAFEELKGKLEEFVGDAPVLGWNVGFDMGFLRQNGVRFESPAYDVLEMVRRRLSSRRGSGRRRRFTLGSIARELNIKLARAHRATDDALAVVEIFRRVMESNGI